MPHAHVPNARDRPPVTSSVFVDRMRPPVLLCLCPCFSASRPRCVFSFSHSCPCLCNQRVVVSHRHARMYVGGGCYCIFCATWTTPDWQMRSAQQVQVTGRAPRDPPTVRPRPPVGRFITTAHTVQMYSCRCISTRIIQPFHCFSCSGGGSLKTGRGRMEPGYFLEHPCITGQDETVRLAGELAIGNRRCFRGFA